MKPLYNIPIGCGSLSLAFIILLFSMSILKSLFSEEKKEEAPKRKFLYFDMTNGRPIYPEDTFYLCKSPINPHEWITKEEAESIRQNIRNRKPIRWKSNATDEENTLIETELPEDEAED